MTVEQVFRLAHKGPDSLSKSLQSMDEQGVRALLGELGYDRGGRIRRKGDVHAMRELILNETLRRAHRGSHFLNGGSR